MTDSISNLDGRKEVAGLYEWIELDIETGQICPKAPLISFYQGKLT
jgi:hypothetical protein